LWTRRTLGTNTTTQNITVNVTDVNELSLIALADFVSTTKDDGLTFNPPANDTVVVGGYTVFVTA